MIDPHVEDDAVRDRRHPSGVVGTAGDAVISNLEVIGEASHNIKVRFPEFAASHQELPLAFGFVEPVQPPLPMHIFAQQVMGLAPQENGVTASDWATWLGRAPKLCGLDTAQFTVLI